MTISTNDLKITVCDDVEDRCKDAADLIEKATGAKTVRIYGKHLVALITELDSFANAVVGGREEKFTAEFDGQDIIFLDYRLEELVGIGPFSPKSENIIGMIRAFTDVGYIVSYNVFPKIDFDLKNVFGAQISTADFSISLHNLGEPGLWQKGASDDGFCPSYWPNLLRAHERRKAQIQAIQTEIETDKSVLDFLGFVEGRRDRLSIDALGSLFPRGAGAANLYEATFPDLFETAADDLSPKWINSILDKTRSGEGQLHTVVSRMCAFKLERWLRLHVLGPQDALVDLPHLVDRTPQIVTKVHLNDLDKWNQYVIGDDLSFIDDKFLEAILSAEFQNWKLWFDRRAFWWPEISEIEEIIWPEFTEEFVSPNFVFCEDTSRFIIDDDTQVFRIHQVSAHRRRFIERIEGREYAPLSRLRREDE